MKEPTPPPIRILHEDESKSCSTSHCIKNDRWYNKLFNKLGLRKDIDHSNTIILSKRDYKRFIAALANPPKSNAALRKLFKENTNE